MGHLLSTLLFGGAGGDFAVTLCKLHTKQRLSALNNQIRQYQLQQSGGPLYPSCSPDIAIEITRHQRSQTGSLGTNIATKSFLHPLKQFLAGASHDDPKDIAHFVSSRGDVDTTVPINQCRHIGEIGSLMHASIIADWHGGVLMADADMEGNDGMV